MVQWDNNGDTRCNSCGKQGYGDKDRHKAVQRLRAAGWHHAQGVTLGGRNFEEILCPGCAKDGYKRTRNKAQIAQDPLPMMEEKPWQANSSRRRNDST